MLLVCGALAGALAGRLAGGSFWNLARIRFRWPVVVLAALVVKEASIFSPLNLQSEVAVAFMLSLLVLIGWTFWHRDRLPGIWIVSLGMSLNFAAVAANLGHMPIPASLAHHGAPRQIADQLVRQGVMGQYIIATGHTHLNQLGDQILLPPPLGRLFPQAYSVGDLVSLLGVFVVLFLAVAPHLLLNRRFLPVDVERGSQALVLTAALPGFEPEEIKVEVTDQAVDIRGRRPGPNEETATNTRWERHERFTGALHRHVGLPAHVLPERAEATMRNGLLRVTLPLRKAGAREIPVQADAVAGADEWGAEPRPTGAESASGSTWDTGLGPEPPVGPSGAVPTRVLYPGRQ